MKGLQRIGLCVDCHKAFDSEAKPGLVYCGHLQAVAYRHDGKTGVRAMQSTGEAIHFIQGLASQTQPQAKRA